MGSCYPTLNAQDAFRMGHRSINAGSEGSERTGVEIDDLQVEEMGRRGQGEKWRYFIRQK